MPTAAVTIAGVLLLGLSTDPKAGMGVAERLQGWLLATIAVPFSKAFD